MQEASLPKWCVQKLEFYQHFSCGAPHALGNKPSHYLLGKGAMATERGANPPLKPNSPWFLVVITWKLIRMFINRDITYINWKYSSHQQNHCTPFLPQESSKIQDYTHHTAECSCAYLVYDPTKIVFQPPHIGFTNKSFLY